MSNKPDIIQGRESSLIGTEFILPEENVRTLLKSKFYELFDNPVGALTTLAKLPKDFEGLEEMTKYPEQLLESAGFFWVDPGRYLEEMAQVVPEIKKEMEFVPDKDGLQIAFRVTDGVPKFGVGTYRVKRILQEAAKKYPEAREVLLWQAQRGERIYWPGVATSVSVFLDGTFYGVLTGIKSPGKKQNFEDELAIVGGGTVSVDSLLAAIRVVKEAKLDYEVTFADLVNIMSWFEVLQESGIELPDPVWLAGSGLLDARAVLERGRGGKLDLWTRASLSLRSEELQKYVRRAIFLRSANDNVRKTEFAQIGVLGVEGYTPLYTSAEYLVGNEPTYSGISAQARFALEVAQNPSILDSLS